MSQPTKKVCNLVDRRDEYRCVRCGVSNERSDTSNGIIGTAPKELVTVPRSLTLNQGLVDWRAAMQSTRTLNRGDVIPPSEPKRYLNASGYVRLRWLVAPAQYVEVYEHRFIAGLPPAHVQVHHVNRNRQDNRPENLSLMTRREHSLLHQREDAPKYAARKQNRDGYRSTEAMQKAHRRIAREDAILERSLRMKDAYERGLTTTEVGKLFEIHPSQVSRHLRRIGVHMRPFGRWAA